MTGINSVTLQQVIVHKVGNTSHGEELKLSANPPIINDETARSLLTRYFPGDFSEQAIPIQPYQLPGVLLAQFLYNKSTHVKVKEGELYVVHFNKES